MLQLAAFTILVSACGTAVTPSPTVNEPTPPAATATEAAAPSSPAAATTAPSVDTSVTDAWRATATQYRSMIGQQFDYDCPEGGEPDTIWGTDLYTDDSSVCTAAVHVGIITLADGGTVTIEMRAGEDSYEDSERNGIESSSYPAWGGSFVVIDD